MDSDVKPTTVYDGKFVDRNPDIKAAGNLRNFGSSVADCLFISHREPYGYVKRFLDSNIHPVGHTTQLPERVDDSCIANKLCHGVGSYPSEPVEDLIYPPQLTTLQYIQSEIAEKSYPIRSKLPLGKVPIYNELPIPNDNGKVVENPITASELLHYSKDLLREYPGKNKLGIGQHINRHYNYHFNPNDCFGDISKGYEDGRLAKRVISESSVADKFIPIPVNIEEFRKKNYHKLGEGLPSQPDLLLKETRAHSSVKKNQKNEINFLNELRQDPLPEIISTRRVLTDVTEAIKNEGFNKFDEFLKLCHFFDKSKAGRISLTDLKFVCREVKMPITYIQLKQLVEWCGLYFSNKAVDYVKLNRILNPATPYLSGETQKTKSDKEDPNTCVDNIDFVDKVKVTNSEEKIDQIIVDLSTQRSTGSDITPDSTHAQTKDFTKFGLPIIRSDHPAPIIRKFIDVTNYGDQADAYTLLYPSICTQNGLSKEDLLKPRSKEELFDIFKNVDSRIDCELFDKLWAAASDASFDQTVSAEGIIHELKNIWA